MEEGQSVCDSWITSSSHEAGKSVSSPSEGKGQWYHHCQTHSRLNQQYWTSIVPVPGCEVSSSGEALNIWGHLGLLAKTTAVLEMRHFYFQLWSQARSPPVYRSLDPETPARVSQRPKQRQMQKLCVDVSVQGWICLIPPRREKKKKKNSTISISFITASTSHLCPEPHNPQTGTFPHAALNTHLNVRGCWNTRSQAAADAWVQGPSGLQPP